MRVGLTLVMLAAAGAAAATLWHSSDAADDKLAVVSEVGAGGVARVAVPQPERAANGGAVADSPAAPRFFGFALPFGTIEGGQRAPVDSQPARPAELDKKTQWSSDVVVYHTRNAEESRARTAEIAQATVVNVPAPVPAVAPRRDKPQHELVRELQRELKRVGCYAGDVDGSWGPSSRRSMRAFMERVSTSLQSDDPDLIQLTLVRGFPGVVCNAAPGTMTAGTTTAGAPPSPTLVRGQAPAPIQTSPIMVGSIETPSAPPMRVVPLEGRMAVGGPVLEATQASPVPSLTAPPIPAPAPRVARPRPNRTESTAATARRGDRSWTKSFFNQY